MLERIRLAIRDWLCAPSAAESERYWANERARVARQAAHAERMSALSDPHSPEFREQAERMGLGDLVDGLFPKGPLN